MRSISAVVMCYNEAEFLPITLPPLIDSVNELIILDMGSTDDSFNIYKTLLRPTDRVIPYLRRNLFIFGFSHPRNYAAKFCSSEWILSIDADELVLPDEIRSHFGLTAVSRNVYDLERKNYALQEGVTLINTDRIISEAPSNSERHRRLYRNSPQIRFEGLVHEEIREGDKSAYDTCGRSSVTIHHLSSYRTCGGAGMKEELYAYLLLKANAFPSFRHGTNGWYFESYIPDNWNDLVVRANHFATQHRLPSFFDIKNDFNNKSIGHPIPTISETKNLQPALTHDRLFDLSIAAPLNQVELSRFGHPGVTALWCGWNHPLVPESRRLYDILVCHIETWRWGQFIKGGDTCIDIGAHSGDTTVPMAVCSLSKTGHRRGTVLAIEPNSKVLPVLSINAALNSNICNIIASPYAVTSRAGEIVEIADHGNDDCNGGIIYDGFSSKLKDHLNAIRKSTIIAEGMPLKDICEMHLSDEDMSRLSFIKTDCEGFDKEILRSSLSLIEQYKPTIFIEWFNYFSESDTDDMFSAIKEIGYVAHNPISLLQVTKSDKIDDLILLPKAWRQDS